MTEQEEIEAMAAELEWTVMWTHDSAASTDSLDWTWIAKELHREGWRLPQ